MTDLTVVFTNCAMQRGSITRPAAEAMELWATYADLLLTGSDLGVDLPDAEADAHIVQVMVRMTDADVVEGEPYVIATFYLACEHDFPINRDERVQSRLLQPPEPVSQIIVPGGRR